MNRIVLTAILSTTCLALPGLAAETNQQRGKRVLDEALAAMGGKSFLAMRDRVESGRAYSFYREQLSGLSRAKIYTRYLTQADPDKLALREREAFGKNEDSAILFTGGNGYEITFRGARPLAEVRLSRFRDSTFRDIFYILRHRLNEPGMIFESRGSDLYENQPVEIVDITDSENRTVTVYFLQSSKLPLRQVFERRDPKTRYKDEEVTIFAKYRDVGGGVMWPFTMRRERNGEKIFEIFSDSVTIDQDLDDALFTLPANLKILPRAK